MSDPILIDTSMWNSTLRRSGDATDRMQVEMLMRSGRAAWCEPIRLELWRGVGSVDDRKHLSRLEADLLCLVIDQETWDTVCRIANLGRAKGYQFPSQDLLIFCCSKQHDVALLSRDKHFDQLELIWKAVK